MGQVARLGAADPIAAQWTVLRTLIATAARGNRDFFDTIEPHAIQCQPCVGRTKTTNFSSKSGGGTATARGHRVIKGGPLNMQYNSSRCTFWWLGGVVAPSLSAVWSR